MGSIVEKITGFFKGGDSGENFFKKPRAKLLNMLVMIGAAGVLLIVLANAFAPAKPEVGPETRSESAGKQPEISAGTESTDISSAEDLLNRKLEEALARIEGVGEVDISVNLDSTEAKDYAVNTTTSNRKTEEKDRQGGNRTITEVSDNGQLVLIHQSDSSKEAPVVVKEIKPNVRGVMAVAEGAGDPRVKAQLVYALQVYLDIPLHKVVVMPKEGR